MAILPILIYPNPLLKTRCEPVTAIDSELLRFIDDLSETLMDSPGCVGIAAPQVGVLKRLIIVDVGRSAKPFPNHGRMVLINPTLVWQEGEVLAREGCLSLPHLTANVKRPKQIRFVALTPGGETIEIDTADFEARVVLHEADHLDGVLFLDRVSSLKTDVFRRKNYAATRPQEDRSEPPKGSG